MLTCKQASYLASKKLDKKLTGSEKFNLYFHTAMCGLCRHYARDMQKLHELMLKAAKSGQVLLPESVKLSEQSRERIKQLLDKALKSEE